MVLVILAAVWAVVLVPPWVRRRADLRPARSVSAFRRQLESLERTLPGHRAVAGRRRPDRAPLIRPAVSSTDARRRRRQVLWLLGAVDVVALATVVAGAGVVADIVLVIAVMASAAYVALVARTGRQAEERRKIRTLPRPVPAAEPELRRTASR